MEENKVQSIDEYISGFAPELQEILDKLRKVIKEAVPEAEEKMSWQMPTFALHGNLVHFAVCKNHIGFYPTPSGINAFENELAEYKKTKGAIHFPIKNPLPYELVGKIAKFRAAENKQRAEEKLQKIKKK